MTAVLICDEPTQLRATLAARLSAVPGIHLVDWADTVDAALATLAATAFDVVLLSSATPGVGPSDAVSSLRYGRPELRVIMLTLGADPDRVVAAVDAGALGYLARDAAIPELAAALAAVNSPVDPVVTAVPLPRHNLTDRELQVLQGMSKGLSNSQIGTELFLSEDTIKTHARRLFRKMEVNDRAHAVAEGLRQGLLS